jgi:hypothetical protein
MRRGESTWVELAAGALGELWRCRLELGLLAALAGCMVFVAGLVGEVAGALVVTGGVGALVAMPRSRGWVLRALRASAIRRAWWRAWTDCELPRVRAGRVTAVPAGELVRVRASRGSSLEDVEQRAEELAVCLQAREVRVARDADNAATGTVTLVRRDPFAELVSVPWPHRDADVLSL